MMKRFVCVWMVLLLLLSAMPAASAAASLTYESAVLGFSLTLTCEEGVSVITDKESLFGLKRWNRPHGADRQEFFQKLGICGSR